MKRTIQIIAGLLFVAGCTAEGMEATTDAMIGDSLKEMNEAWDACLYAETYGDAYGTPVNRGLCWDYTISVSRTGSYTAYYIQKYSGGRAILVYDGNDHLVSVTE